MRKLVIGKIDPRAVPIDEEVVLENGGRYVMESTRESYKILMELDKVNRIEIYILEDGNLSPSFLSRFHIIEKSVLSRKPDVMDFLFRKTSGLKDRFGWVFE